MRFGFIILFNLFIFNAFAGKEDNSVGARSAGLANTSTLFTDFWAAENNPAGLGFVKDFGAGISYANHFMLKEFGYKSMVLAYPSQKGAFGLSIGQFGYNLYNENKVGLSYGQRLSNTFSLGVQLNYLNTQIGEGYGSKSAISGNVGLLAELSDQVKVAAIVINPNRVKLAEYQNERISTLLKLAVSYSFSEKVILMSEIQKDIDFDYNAIVAVEYLATDIIYLRAGYGTNPSISTFGFGIKLKEFDIDIASGFHSIIGFTPQISLSYAPKSKQEKK